MCATFTDFITEIDNLDVVMSMYDLIEYSNNYRKTSASLWQCCRDHTNVFRTDSEPFKFKARITRKKFWWCYKWFWNGCTMKILK